MKKIGFILLCYCLILCQALASEMMPAKNYFYWASMDQSGHIHAWQQHTQVPFNKKAVDIKQLSTPLGSVWKLFVYAYIVDNNIASNDYYCKGNSEEEKYCCEKGGSIALNQALIKSCGLFFQPQRLAINPLLWQQYWQKQQAPKWLLDLKNLDENNYLSVKDLLLAIASIPSTAKRSAELNLLNIWLQQELQNSFASFGSQVRVKTFSMSHPQRKELRIGGGAGWLANGDIFWMLALGNSRHVLQQSGAILHNDINTITKDDQHSCVKVDYLRFLSNPIMKVSNHKGDKIAGGRLAKGDYFAFLKNGRKVNISSADDLELRKHYDGSYRLIGTLSINQYVARVLDREASARPEQAAKALAIAIRTYLINEASGNDGCLMIKDSTLTQRVSIQPASDLANKIASATDQLIIHNSTGQYKKNTDKKNQLSWEHAVVQANDGLNFIQILALAYPHANLKVLGSDKIDAQCDILTDATIWLQQQQPRWHKILHQQQLHFYSAKQPRICKLSRGTPYSDEHTNSIYIRQLKTEYDQITLAHEYLHLIFAEYPFSHDYQWIDGLAKQLILGRHHE